MSIELAKGVFQFPTGAFNWYVIEEGGRLTLVDAGFPGHYRTWIDGLTEMGWRQEDLEAIVITHAHADHTGFAERLRRDTGVPVYVHREDLKQAGRILQLPWAGLLANSWRPYTAWILGEATWNGAFSMPYLTKLTECLDGQVLDIPGRPRVIHAAGHTSGEIALLLEDRKVLLSGDTLVTRNLFSGAHGEPQVPNRALNQDDRLAQRSLDRLRELGELTLLPGHGRPWRGSMAAAVDGARALASQA